MRKRLSLFKEDFNFILKNGISINERFYNFENKTIENFTKETKNINYIIVEGIFAKEFSSTIIDKNYYFLELKIHKDECKKRVLQRDVKDRGKSKKQAENDFIKSWNIYYEKINNKRRKNNTDEYIITEKTKINLMIEKLFN